jgi:hypothetical protein
MRHWRNPLGAMTAAVAVMEMVGGDAGARAREIIKRQLQEERSSDCGRGGLGIGDAHVVKPSTPLSSPT